MGGPDDEPPTIEVPNPHYTALKALHDDIEADRATLGKALNGATAAMQGGAWTGPQTATRFGKDLAARDRELPGYVTQILHAIQLEMDATPKTMTRPVNRGMYEVM